MRSVLRRSTCTLALVLALAANAHAQTLFLSGQSVQPIFEGWQENPDGTFSFLFGYLNRNYEEEPFIAVGANNTFEPGPADRGQPTHFYPRRQQFVFSVTVPADWGKRELVWTVTHNGQKSTAVGSLAPVWMLEEGVWKANRGSGINGRRSKAVPVNKPPSVTLVGSDTVSVTLPQTLTLTVVASDDGNPGPRKPRGAVRRPGDQTADSKEMPVAITGLPSRNRQAGPTTQDMVLARNAYETGLAVTWLHYRGPGSVTFEPMTRPIKPEGAALTGQAMTTVHFSEPGAYIIRVVGDDGNLTNGTNVTVTVRAADSSTTGAQR
jgi:hypothetical protein